MYIPDIKCFSYFGSSTEGLEAAQLSVTAIVAFWQMLINISLNEQTYGFGQVLQKRAKGQDWGGIDIKEWI